VTASGGLGELRVGSGCGIGGKVLSVMGDLVLSTELQADNTIRLTLNKAEIGSMDIISAAF
jgi:hypothetical protein